MHDFEYVPNYEWEPVRDELLDIIHRLQDEVREHFTFQYHFVGSSKRRMITRDQNSMLHGVADVNLVGEDDVPLHGAKPKRLLDLMERIPWEESVAVCQQKAWHREITPDGHQSVGFARTRVGKP